MNIEFVYDIINSYKKVCIDKQSRLETPIDSSTWDTYESQIALLNDLESTLKQFVKDANKL